jgi:rhamnogalacturonan acetylesterase
MLVYMIKHESFLKSGFVGVLFLLSLASFCAHKPTLYLIGDSTVKAGQGNGENGMWGWGSVIVSHFDTTQINLQNLAIGGRSSRTFLTDGRWQPILDKMQAGDFLIIQFGHNDDWAINDTIRARGSITGVGADSVSIYNLLTKKQEVVHSFGWYLSKYASEAKAKGVEVFLCSQVPFCKFENQRVIRKEEYYPKWTKEIAQVCQVGFIDLHERSAQVYDKLGMDETKKRYFTPKDNVHTNREGAALNAENVVWEIKQDGFSNLKKYIRP